MTTLLRTTCCVIAIASFGCTQTGAPVVEFVKMEPEHPRLGEVATITFRALDYRGETLAGTPIGFRLKTEQPGATLTPTSVTTLKGTGYAETQILVTGRVTSVVIVASSPPCEGPCKNGELEVESPPLSFAGATVPNAKQFTFQCGSVAGDASGGRHALGAWDETRHLIAGTKITCFAHTADRNGDGVSNAQVSFLTEAGTIGPTDTSKTDVIGNAEILYKTSLPFPKETDPVNWTWTPVNDGTHTGEYVSPLWMHPFEWTSRPIVNYGMAPNLQEPRRRDPVRKTTAGGNITNNNRDNLVALIAVTAGEESFVDVNNNGTYDNSEPFEDLTEPFVDANDNGTWDSDERYIDTNGNGTWDGKNGSWDSSSFIWIADKMIWTGLPEETDLKDTVDPIFDLIEPPPGTTPTIEVFEGIPVRIILCDPWLNMIAQNGGGDACEIGDADDTAVVKAYPKGNEDNGVPLTYPSCPVIPFSIKDVRDPLLPLCSQPGCNPPRRDPPVAWNEKLCCVYTSSPMSGYKARVCAGSVAGFVH